MHEKAPTPRTSSPEWKAGIEHLTSAEQAIYAKLYPEYRAAAVNPHEFTNYDKAQIEADLQYVRNRKREFAQDDAKNPHAQETRRRGELAEAIVYHGIQENGWLGGDAQVMVASEFDDITHGVDMVAEFIDTEGYRLLALSVDATFSSEQLKTKIRSIKKRIEKGKLSEIKYFKSDELNIAGRKDQVPLAAVFLPLRIIRHVCELEQQRMRLREAITGGNASEIHRRTLAEVNAALEVHPIRRLLHHQLALQLGAFAEYAERNTGSEAIADALHAAASRVAEEMKTSDQDPLPEEYQFALDQLAESLDDILA